MANGFDTFNSPTNHYRISSSREILASVGLIWSPHHLEGTVKFNFRSIPRPWRREKAAGHSVTGRASARWRASRRPRQRRPSASFQPLSDSMLHFRPSIGRSSATILVYRVDVKFNRISIRISAFRQPERPFTVEWWTTVVWFLSSAHCAACSA